MTGDAGATQRWIRSAALVAVLGRAPAAEGRASVGRRYRALPSCPGDVRLGDHVRARRRGSRGIERVRVPIRLPRLARAPRQGPATEAGLGASSALPETVSPRTPAPYAPASDGAPTVVELGCGTGYVSVGLACRGALAAGVDPTPGQLRIARQCQDEFGLWFPLVRAAGEQVPLRDASFDLVISEYGAAVWADPYRWIPEAAAPAALWR